MKKAVYLFTVLTLLIAGCAEDEISTFGSISGTVKDNIDNEPLSGVRVIVSPGDVSAVTGSDGTFSFYDMESQDYTLNFIKEGYISDSEKISVVPGQNSDASITLSRIVPILGVTPKRLDFGNDTTTLALDISNTGKGELQWSISEGLDWLSCQPTSGKTINESSSVVVTVSRAQLERGSYSGTLVISSNGGSQTIPVTISAGNIALKVEPTELDFGTLTNSTRLTLRNIRTGNIDYQIESSADWLVVSKKSGTVTQTDYVNAIVTREGLSAGKYNATITISSNSGNIVIPVKMEVAVNAKPTVSVENVTNIIYNSAVLHGSMVSVGSAKVTRYGFCYGEQPGVTIENSFTNLGDCSEPIAFESTIMNLKAETKYYVRAYAENSVGIVYSDKELSFTTTPLPTIPSVTTEEISEITSTSVKAKGNITALGNVAKVLHYGHVWSKTAQPTLENGKYTDLGESDVVKVFTSGITELEAHTTYHVRAYATNEKGTAYGKDTTFTTTNTDVKISTSDVTEITHEAATSGGTISDDGGHAITERGICWAQGTSEPTVADNYIAASTETKSISRTGAQTKSLRMRPMFATSEADNFSCRMTGLSKTTKYTVRAYAKTATGSVFYGEAKEFSTTEEILLPTLSDAAISNVQISSATLTGRITSDGNGDIIECGFCYSTQQQPTVENGSKITCNPASLDMGASITGLTEGTTYYVRAYAKNAAGIAYSENDADFTTLSVTVPKLSSVTAENVGRTTAYVSASIMETGNADVTECGFCWATNPFPTVYDNKIACEVANSFKTKLQELPLQTMVYVRAYAVNSKGTGYSADVSFTTTDTDIDIWDGQSVATKFGGGMGTESNPIIINSADQLKLLADNVNKGNTYTGVYFKLDVNIALSNHLWTPIGNSSKSFSGTFDGNNHTISGLNITTDTDYQGLFGYINNGTVKNLVVEGNINAGTKSYVGGICGQLMDGTISACTNKAKISGYNYVGGICGYAESSKEVFFQIQNCTNYGEITGNSYVGGILGEGDDDYFSSSSSLYSSITDNSNIGTVSGQYYIGGICGYNYCYSYNGTTIVNNRNSGNIISSSSSNGGCGGICGYIYCSRSYVLQIHNNVNLGEIVGESSYHAIIGYYSTSSISYYTNNHWLFDIVNNKGMESGCGDDIKNVDSSNSWFNHDDSQCVDSSGNDLIQQLNSWVSSNPGHKKWKYETIDGYACPVFDEE